MGIHLESEVLKCVAVPHGIGGVVLGQRDNTRVLALGAVVLDNTLTDLRDVKKTVEQVGSPVKIGGAIGNVVAEHAHALEGSSELIR